MGRKTEEEERRKKGGRKKEERGRKGRQGREGGRERKKGRGVHAITNLNFLESNFIRITLTAGLEDNTKLSLPYPLLNIKVSQRVVVFTNCYWLK